MSRERMRSTTRGFKLYYNPDTSGLLRMDTNTNALGSNPAAGKFLSKGGWDLNDYPNTYSNGLRDALGELYGLERDNFVAGSGSDEMLDVVFKTFTEWGDNCVVPVPSYVLYDYFVGMNGGRALQVDLTGDFQLDVEAMTRKDAKVIIMPSPNNPTGNAFRPKDIEDILSRFDGIVVVDEAYGEYSEPGMIKRVEEFDNLVVLRTFSKAYSMAGLRVGYAAANKQLAEMMNCVKIPYSLNFLSEGAAIAALKDRDFIKRTVQLVEKERPRLEKSLKDLGFETYPSDCNFILAKCPADHSLIVAGLKDEGILIRDFGSRRRTENCVRITVGDADMNSRLVKAMEKVLGDQKC